MKAPESIVCKPTPWFIFRAAVMLVMFGVFAFLFFKDGSTGYRKANEIYYLSKTFDQAIKDFRDKNASGTLGPEDWKAHAARQNVAFPADPALLPGGLKQPMPWPEILHDFEKVKPLQYNKLWQEYSATRKFPAKAIEHPYDAGKISEQWVVFYICAALAGGAAFFLLRTLGRSISADASGLKTQQGKKVAFDDIKTLDLRKWDTKGLAYLDYDGASGKGRVRIDGLTYGGFKPENGQPAEQLMALVRSKISGEILEYAEIPAQIAPTDVGSENN